MKVQRTGFVLWGMVLLAGVTGWAQETEKTSPYLIMDQDFIGPGENERYFGATERLFQFFRDNNLPCACLAHIGDDGSVLYLYSADSYAVLDEWPATFRKMAESVGQAEWSAAMQDLETALAYASKSAASFRPDLSYTPKNPAFVFDPRASCFCSITYYYMKPGSEAKTAEIHHKALRMLEEKQSNLPMRFYQTAFGPDMPCLISLFYARDKEQFGALLEERRQVMGGEFFDLYNQVTPYIRRIENKEYTYDPARSYLPERKAEEAETKPDKP